MYHIKGIHQKVKFMDDFTKVVLTKRNNYTECYLIYFLLNLDTLSVSYTLLSSGTFILDKI